MNEKAMKHAAVWLGLSQLMHADICDYDDELYHYGVKGQKWGVRRYQYPDGRLTQRGKRHLKQHFKETTDNDKRYNAGVQRVFGKHGISSNGYEDKIAKGSILKRYTYSDNETQRKYDGKYMFLTQQDEDSYYGAVKNNELGGHGKNVYKDSYEATADLRIANPKKVVDHILEKYGDKEVREDWKTYKSLDTRSKLIQIVRESDNGEWEGQYAKDMKRRIANKLDKILYKDGLAKKELYSYYRDAGYDGICDPEDWVQGIQYPVIIFDSSPNITKVSSEKVAHSEIWKGLVDLMHSEI